MRVTGLVLPVLAHSGWTVETIWADRGDGLREWIELRRGDRAEYCCDRPELLGMLHRHGLFLADFTEIEPDDGCE